VPYRLLLGRIKIGQDGIFGMGRSVPMVKLSAKEIEVVLGEPPFRDPAAVCSR